MKNVYRLLPVSTFDIPGMEQWLEEQANAGLFPTHLGSYASFSKAGVPGTRFRLEPWGKLGTEPTAEQLELYQNAGWEYAFPVTRTYFLFYTTNPNAPELYSDLTTRGQSLERLAKQIKRVRISRLLLPIVLVALLLTPLFWPASRFDVQPERWVRLPLLALDATSPMLLFFLLIACFQIHQELRDYRTLLGTYQALGNGVPPQASPYAQRKIVRWNRVQLVLMPILLLCIVLNYTTLKNHPISEFHLPYIALSELEREPVTTYSGLFGYDSPYSAEENQAIRRFSLLSPTWYEVSQFGYSLQAGTQSDAFSANPENGTYRYSPDLEMTRFSLLLPALSRPVAKAQMDTYRAINLRWSYEEVAFPGTDFVILAQADNDVGQMAAIGCGRQVVVFSYAGQENLADHLELLTQMVTASK